jgi:hypothetical protein
MTASFERERRNNLLFFIPKNTEKIPFTHLKTKIKRLEKKEYTLNQSKYLAGKAVNKMKMEDITMVDALLK